MVQQICVRGGEVRLLQLADDAAVQSVRDELAALESVDASQLTLSCCGVVLTDAVAVSSLQGDIEVTVGLKGGKVHGSLARAGKVKGQTPKVEKEEGKRKHVTGRAKRRNQYRKRFVVVVQTFGKKKGPNSNS